MKKLLLAFAMSFILVPLSSSAYALSIGINTDPTNVSTFNQIDHIVYQTDTGLAVGFQNTGVPSPTAPYDITFILQGQVGTASLGGKLVDLSPVPFSSEITFTAKFTETVISEGINTAGHQVASFSSGEDLNSMFNMYLDSSTKADPNTATGYTDGTPILSGHMLSQTSSFDAANPGTLGTGSFNVKVAIDSVDSSVIDLPAGYAMYFTITTGTLNLPPTYSPTTMWDGTDVSSGIPLKFDGSTDFGAVPEPGTLVLLGFGMIALAGIGKKRLQNKEE